MDPQVHLVSGAGGCALANDGGIAIIVDALRASTTVAALLDHGAARVLVVAEVDASCALASRLDNVLLVGERDCLPPPGFHLGNSPREVLAGPRLDGRLVVFTSSNGAQRLTACGGARLVAMGTLANLTPVARWARAAALALARDVVLVSAGKFPDETYQSPEDDAACAALAAAMALPLAPASQEAFACWQREIAARGFPAIFHASPHAARLVHHGLSADIDFCATPDTLRAVPLVSGQVTLHGQVIGVELRNVAGE